MKGHPIDIDGMHRYLFRKSASNGSMRIHQRDFAKELGVAFETVCRMLKRMTDQGRIKRIGSRSNNVGVYSITDPQVWKPQEVDND